MKNRIEGKTIVITGATTGIGAAVAQLLKERGALIVTGSRSSRFDETNRTLEMPLDVTDEESVHTFCEKAAAKFGPIDVLINCAGTGTFGHVTSSSTEDFDNMIAVNLRGSYLMCKHIGAEMEKQGYGHIINLISIAGKTALAGGGGYTASKFGLLGLTNVLQAELRPKGIEVTAFLPGAVDSPFWDHITPKPDVERMIPVATVAEHLFYVINKPPGAFMDEVTIMPPLGIL